LSLGIELGMHSTRASMANKSELS